VALCIAAKVVVGLAALSSFFVAGLTLAAWVCRVNAGSSRLVARLGSVAEEAVVGARVPVVNRAAVSVAGVGPVAKHAVVAERAVICAPRVGLLGRAAHLTGVMGVALVFPEAAAIDGAIGAAHHATIQVRVAELVVRAGHLARLALPRFGIAGLFAVARDSVRTVERRVGASGSCRTTDETRILGILGAGPHTSSVDDAAVAVVLVRGAASPKRGNERKPSERGEE
jgi:hypothetical protein